MIDRVHKSACSLNRKHDVLIDLQLFQEPIVSANLIGRINGVSIRWRAIPDTMVEFTISKAPLLSVVVEYAICLLANNYELSVLLRHP